MDRRAFLLSLAVTLPFSCKRSTKTVIGVVPQGVNAIFWQSVHAGVMAAGRKHNVEILWNGPSQETEYARQIQIVESMINQEVSGIAISPSDRTALVRVVERATAAGIPVTIFDSGIDTDKYVSFVATDNYSAGATAAITLGELLNGEGDVAMVKHAPGNDSTMKRERGFEDTLRDKLPRLTIVNQQFCMTDRARAMAVTEDMMTAHPELSGIFCSSEAASVGAARAIKVRGMAGKIKVVGFDSAPSLEKSLQDGVIDALVVQDPFNMGYLGVETVVTKLSGGIPPKHIDSPTRVIRLADLKDPEVQRLLNPNIESYLNSRSEI
jgi:ribose transport system substrate-binding protein